MSATDIVNEVRIIWSDVQVEFLIDQRIGRNRYFFHTLHKIISFVIIRMEFFFILRTKII